MGVNERKIEAQSGAGGRGSHICHKRLLAFIVFATAAFFAFQQPLLPLIAGRQAGRQMGGREWGRIAGKEGERNRTPLSVSFTDSANLVFKARAKLSLRRSKPCLVQQLYQFEKKWPRARSSRELHSVILCFLSRNFSSNHYFRVNTH